MIYLDNASTTYPKMPSFYDKTMLQYKDMGINFSRNNSDKSKEGINIKESLTNNIKKIFSSQSYQVILNSSATFSLNEILTGLDYNKIKNIYVSPFEHNSVVRVLKKIQKENDINIIVLKFNNFILDEEDMRLNFISKTPDLIVINHASNVFGNILPVELIFNEGKKYNAITVLDASQTGGVLDFSSISPLSDFIVFAGHKNLYGPSGIGGYLFNKNINLNPMLYGGTGIKSDDEDMPSDIPEKFEAGSPNTLGIIGLKIATDELLDIGIENIREKKEKLLEALYETLSEFDYDLKIESNIENNIGIISITGISYSPQELEIMLNEHDVIVRSGLQCAPAAHKHMGTSNGSLRFSVGYFNTDEDIIKLKDILDEIF